MTPRERAFARPTEDCPTVRIVAPQFARRRTDGLTGIAASHARTLDEFTAALRATKSHARVLRAQGLRRADSLLAVLDGLTQLAANMKQEVTGAK